LKVTHIIDSAGYYGAEAFLINLCACQKALGVDVNVISIGKKNQGKKAIEEKLESIGVPCIAWRMLPIPDPMESFKLARFLKDYKSDIAHSHGYKGNILLGMVPKKFRSIPFVTTIHGYTSSTPLSKLRLYHYTDRLIHRMIDAVVLVSDGIRHQVNEKSIQDKIFVIFNGLSSTIPDYASIKLELFDDENFKISSVGRLSEEKNFQLLISSMPLVIQKIPNAKLAIFGEGHERNKLQALIHDLNLSRNVVLAGFTSEPERVYRNSDLIVNCSTTEGMPISLLEAMREGCPFIASDIPANSRLTEDSNLRNQLFFLNKESLAHKIIEIYEMEPKDLKLLKEKMKESFLERYTIEKSTYSYIKLYESLIEKRKSEACIL
jgi:glycosyltransferase involved in cell wall biosynthesis